MRSLTSHSRRRDTVRWIPLNDKAPLIGEVADGHDVRKR